MTYHGRRNTGNVLCSTRILDSISEVVKQIRQHGLNSLLLGCSGANGHPIGLCQGTVVDGVKESSCALVETELQRECHEIRVR